MRGCKVPAWLSFTTAGTKHKKRLHLRKKFPKIQTLPVMMLLKEFG